ncbi:MAG: HlyD family secretion protein, partial [Gemmatimonadaceae bacterium]
QLLSYRLVEGDTVSRGARVAVIDTTQLALQNAQFAAQRAAAGAQVRQVSDQLGALEVQHEIAQRTYARTKRLYDDKAATAQQLDQDERSVRVLAAQISAARAQQHGAGRDVAAVAARAAQVRDFIARSLVTNPVRGTVLASYARTGEFVQPGTPLYRIANLDSLDLRAYVTEPQLSSIHLGQRVTVELDAGSDSGHRRQLPGTITWVSSTAEFTPTPVQTRDERADLVYAVKVRVPNPNGVLKIGMPADITLGAAPAAPGAAPAAGGKR